MGSQGTRVQSRTKGKVNMTKETEQLIHLRSVIAERNLEIDKLNKELARVKQIARDRLDKIVNLQQDVAVLEDKLEDTRSELKYEKGVSAHQRSLAGQLALELAQLEDDPRRLEDFDDDAEIEASLERIRDLDELADHGGLWGAHCRGEL